MTVGLDSGRRVLITTLPFGEADPTPCRLLDEADVEYVVNPIGRRLKASEARSCSGTSE